MKKPIVLCILDGCGIRNESDGNAFLNANKPTFDYLWDKYPHSLLEASGSYVGLPEGQMGNSEVGHMNMGAGRVVFQPLEIINRSIKDGTFFKNEKILDIFNHVKKNNSNLHLMGLISDGGVHSHINHLFSLIDMAKQNDVKNVFFDLFLDGRDVPPKSAYKYISMLEEKIKDLPNYRISTISGRYYAMDRDNNYDRLSKSYDAVVYNNAPRINNIKLALEDSYNNNITDEFFMPRVLCDSKLKENDAVLTFNFRPDRLRELFTTLTNNKNGLNKPIINNLKVLTMMFVNDTVLCNAAIEKQNLKNTLGEFLENNDISQLRIAETEKYAHVTYFFDGGHEKNYLQMKKILIPSSKVATYDMKPEMSAYEITDELINQINNDLFEVVILNFANGDMVGHTGNYDAAVKAVETMDKCLKRIYDLIIKKEGVLLITADHGNCDIMWDENKNKITSHTTSKVPFIVTKEKIKLKDGKLANIAPTIIDLLNLKKPKEMSEESLIIK